MSYTQSLKILIQELEKLPGIGSKTAERLGFHLLKISEEDAMSLANAIINVKQNIKRCEICYNIADDVRCEICKNPKRNQKIICVVEQTKDMIALEKTGTYQGVYHILLGRLAPLENMHSENTTVEKLLERVQNSLKQQKPVEELILATNPNLEGDTTALYIRERLKNSPVKISRIARGIPTGGSIEFANQAMLTDALAGRQSFDN